MGGMMKYLTNYITLNQVLEIDRHLRYISVNRCEEVVSLDINWSLEDYPHIADHFKKNKLQKL